MQDFWKTALSFWLPWEEDDLVHGAWSEEQGADAEDSEHMDLMDEYLEDELDSWYPHPNSVVDTWEF